MRSQIHSGTKEKSLGIPSVIHAMGNTPKITLLSACIGISCYLYIFGFHFLDSNGWWRVPVGDPAQHFIALKYYLKEPFRFPLLDVKGLYYPHGVNLFYTDSIPLLAVITKFIYTYTGIEINYFRYFHLICYVAQAVLAWFILKNSNIRSRILIIIGVTTITLSPILVKRIWHTSLCSHFFILYFINTYIKRKNSFLPAKNGICNISMLTAAFFVHPYIWIMSLALYATTAYEVISKDKKTLFPISVDLAIHCTLIILGYSLMVGFDSPFSNQVSGSGYGYYSMNLLAPFLHFPNMGTEIMNPFATPGQREGYNYLGLGVILVLAYVLVRRRTKLKEHIAHNKALFTLLVFLTLFALSNVVYASDVFILKYNLPGFAEKLFNVFRSSGRFFWPVHYVLLIYAIATLDRIPFRKQYLMVSAYVLFALIQFSDLHMLYKITHDAVARGNRNIEQTALWKDVLTGQEALFLLPTINMGMMGNRGFDYKLLNIAANRGIPVNSFNLARSSGPESEASFMKEYLAKLPNRAVCLPLPRTSNWSSSSRIG